MPELPEVETVRRTLEARVLGRRVAAVRMARPDVVYELDEGGRGPARRATTAKRKQALLEGQRVGRITRHGKQLAILTPDGQGVCIHLGMSGSLCVVETGKPGNDGKPNQTSQPSKADHVHVAWDLGGGREVWFRDPRRFGGLWTFNQEAQLHETRWGRLGPDGLVITPKQLHAGLSRTQRALKAALLDQHLVAGLGNIYVDELLYATKLHPRKLASEITKVESGRLVRAMRRILGRAIEAGGSTLRDYVDAAGQAGGFQTQHRVYGRGGEPCRGCGKPLGTTVIAGRTTTACEGCQLGATLTGER